MKKEVQSDLDAECNFAALARPQIETACKYEYMRESRALRAAVRNRANKDFRHPHLYRMRPYLDRLSRLCKAGCPRQFGFWQTEYRIYCSHCNNAVELPCEDWVKKFLEAVRRRAARSAKRALENKKARANVLPSFTRSERYRLVLALLKAGFPKAWRELNDDAQSELVSAIRKSDEDRKKSYPPILIKAGVPERDYEHEHVTPVWRLMLSKPELRWSVKPDSPAEIPFFAGQHSKRKYWYGFIRIDESYNETEAKKAFARWFGERFGKRKGGNRERWKAKLNDLVVMRLWKQFPKRTDAIKRVEHIVKFTIPGSKRVGFKGCKEWWKNHCRAKKEKRVLDDQTLSNAANEEMGRARECALEFFQTLFPGEIPLNYKRRLWAVQNLAATRKQMKTS